MDESQVDSSIAESNSPLKDEQTNGSNSNKQKKKTKHKGNKRKVLSSDDSQLEHDQQHSTDPSPHSMLEEVSPPPPLLSSSPLSPPPSQPVELVQIPDGQGGFKIVRLIQRPAFQPTMWFPLSKVPPVWTVQANINILYWMLVVVSFVIRFWRIDLPSCVVFDEVHFGKFASYYLSQSFFFDVHPPLGKLIFAFIGYWNDFDGSFLFSTIGQEFPKEVPYVVMRGSSALCGALLIPTVYEIMILLGFSYKGALLASFFTLFDNSLQIQSRVIMLDSFVVLFTYLSIMGYLKVYHCRAEAYSRRWHLWLAATGTFLGLLLGVKYTGLLALGCVGLMGLFDLWQIVGDLAVDKLDLFVHMAHRGVYLLGIPLLMNFALFYIHFSILTQSGPGNAFVSMDFQDTLQGGNVPPPVRYSVPENSTLLRYSSSISFRNQDMSCWLHSHKDLYPLKYPDGRGSSYQQQVTCYEFQDHNNFWAIRKPGDPSDPTVPSNDTEPVKNNDIIELVHTGTDKLLNSHDVAAPLSPANQEVAGYINYSAKFIPHLHWKIELQGVKDNIPVFWSPGKTKFRLIHVKSGQAMGCTGSRLPEWGFQQYEIATDRATDSSHTLWTMDDAKHVSSTEEMLQEEEMLRNSTVNQFHSTITRPPRLRDENKTLWFWEKYFELQGRMLAAHGNLGDHQFGASPTLWPFLGKTLPYWLHNKTNAQVTLIGNPSLWWSGTLSIGVFLTVLLFYLLRKQRKCHDVPQCIFQQYWTSGTVLLVGWMSHYLPYFLISRVLFLHHYLPALPFKFMLLAAIFEHGFHWASRSKWYPSLVKRSYQVFVGVFCTIIFVTFLLFAPFTFGYPSLTKSQIMWLRWRPNWDLLIRN